jgi:response regulator RpfG family c-di-GMP phosphodiesterase
MPRRLRILCLEDEPDDAELIGGLLRAAGLTIEMDVTAGRAEFERLLTSAPYDIVLADYKLPGFDAPAALEIVKERAPHVPLICVSGTIGEERAVAIVREGAADYILKDRLARLPLAVERALADAERERAQRQAEEALAESSERLRVALHDTVHAMGAVVELRDPYTSGHERRVTGLAVAIADAMGLDERAVETIRLAGEVHDVGKIGVPAEILSKPGALTTIERNLITQHPVLGYEILKPIAFDGPVAEAVRQHHERSDGSGYPQGLTGDDILLEARILAVADVVEAMASHRPYRPAFGTQIALAEVRNGAGTRYDRDVVAACEQVFAAGFELDAGAAFDAS